MEKLLHERLRDASIIIDHIKTLNDAVPIGKGSDGNDLFCQREAAEVLADEIERYYIPRPRFEDGEPVQFGEKIDADGQAIEQVLWFGATRDGLRIFCDSGNLFDLLPNETLKRPHLKVLDADGVEIKRGDEGWSALTGVKLDPVIGFHDDRFGMKVELQNGFWIEPFIFTHEKPVFDADHVRICKGDTVWDTKGYKGTVIEINPDVPQVVVERGVNDHAYLTPDVLTHREPDSLSKIQQFAVDHASYADGSERDAFMEIADRLTALIERDA